MGDFNLTTRQPRFSLGNYQLQLDPSLKKEIEAISKKKPPSFKLRQLFLQPNWNAFQQNQLNLASFKIPTKSALKAGNEPKVPRAGEIGDLLKAIWGVPVVQQTANRLLDNATNELRIQWNRMPLTGRILLISQSVILSGGALTAILSNKKARLDIFNLLVGHNIPIPVPGATGLSVQLRQRGAGANISNILGSGVSVRGGAETSGQFDVMMTFDVAQWLR
jgi:hypothetical protein